METYVKRTVIFSRFYLISRSLSPNTNLIINTIFNPSIKPGRLLGSLVVWKQDFIYRKKARAAIAPMLMAGRILTDPATTGGTP